MSALLQHRVALLQLDPKRSFPSQSKDTRDMIKEWRHEQRCKLVGGHEHHVRSCYSDDPAADSDLGE